jgi:tripartite-type tricarboxylate transporter receptor subunit TctC
MLVTARTPKPIVDKLHAETTRILSSPAMKEQFASQGLEAVPTTPDEFSRVLRSDIEKWRKVIKAAGLQGG